MKIIIGLGNPEKKYEFTRHNAGFLMLDKIREFWEFGDFKFEKKFNAEISKGNFSGENLLLVKPQTFMNLSGDSVQAILNFYKLTPENIIIIHDDIDIPLGKFKIATDSSSAGHNGVKDVIEKLGTQEFRRIRIGIGKTQKEPASSEDKKGEIQTEEGDCHLPAVHDFVLGKFSKEELETIEKLYPHILKETKKLL